MGVWSSNYRSLGIPLETYSSAVERSFISTIDLGVIEADDEISWTGQSCRDTPAIVLEWKNLGVAGAAVCKGPPGHATIILKATFIASLGLDQVVILE